MNQMFFLFYEQFVIYVTTTKICRNLNELNNKIDLI